MRRPRAFYKDAGVFREYSQLNAVVYETLRSTIKEPVQPYASLTDAYYGAFKLGGGDPDESKMDSSLMLLTSSYLVVLDPKLQPHMMLQTADLMLPTKGQPNPTLLPQGNKRTMKLILADGEEQELVFVDEGKAIAAQALFEDMFFMLVDREASQED